MDKNFLNKTIVNIQDEYLNLLIKIKDQINTENFMCIVDEINIFWTLYTKIINLYLSTISIQDNAYVFTGATYLDLDDFEHYPFVTMGNIHIIDDPLCKYSGVYYKCKNVSFERTLKTQIIQTVNDNIKILKEYSNIFLILPLHLLKYENMKLITKQANNIFLSMFSEKIVDIDTYLNKFNTIEEVVLGLKPNIETQIIFEEYEDTKINLEKRFKDYTNKDDLHFLSGNSYSEKFYCIVVGFIIQSLNIIFNCTNFNLIPYLRYKVTFNYVMIIGQSFSNIPEIKNMLFKSQIAYIFYKIFDKYKFKEIPFNDFYKKINEYNFTEKIESELIEKNITMENAHIQEVIDILNHHIEKCLI